MKMGLCCRLFAFIKGAGYLKKIGKRFYYLWWLGGTGGCGFKKDILVSSDLLGWTTRSSQFFLNVNVFLLFNLGCHTHVLFYGFVPCFMWNVKPVCKSFSVHGGNWNLIDPVLLNQIMIKGLDIFHGWVRLKICKTFILMFFLCSYVTPT